MTITMLMVMIAIFVLFVAVSAARLRKLQRLGEEVQRGLTTLAGNSAALAELVARAAGEAREAFGRGRAEADRILEARAGAVPSEAVAEQVAEAEHLIADIGGVLAAFGDAVYRGTPPREVLCPEAVGRLEMLLLALPPVQRQGGTILLLTVLVNSLMTAALQGATLRPLPAEPQA